MWYQNIRSASFSFVTIHAYDRQTDRRTEGQTDRQNYDSQDCSRICSRGKKTEGVMDEDSGDNEEDEGEED